MYQNLKRMKKLLSTIILSLLLQNIFAQITYMDLESYLEMDKDKITVSLQRISDNWKYSQVKLNPNVEKWTNFETTLTIRNFYSKDNRIIEYFTKNQYTYKELIKQIGRTNKYKPAIIKETPKVIYNFWHSSNLTVVGHIICSETDVICYLQLDIMKNSIFKESEYN